MGGDSVPRVKEYERREVVRAVRFTAADEANKAALQELAGPRAIVEFSTSKYSGQPLAMIVDEYEPELEVVSLGDWFVVGEYGAYSSYIDEFFCKRWTEVPDNG